MKTFTVRELREKTGALIHDAQAGKMNIVTRHGEPVFLAVPFSEELINLGVKTRIAVLLYDQEVLSLGKAAKFAGMSLAAFMGILGELQIPVVRHSPEELAEELEILRDEDK